ncbi:hypothetical protein AVEN_59394-1 [Araneus ventricosus]|uniref:Uncharacterized protein n=1 Tax=Araneus ventricosus TaxID=182803 RepID=A0A4Y2LI56_ARAVE|nr:hypothetical protein AVEN_59394-1 [Araneus ventricosus]
MAPERHACLRKTFAIDACPTQQSMCAPPKYEDGSKVQFTRVIKNYFLTLDRQYKRELRGILADHFSTQSPNLFRSFSERRTDSGLAEITSRSLNQFSVAVFTSLS